MRSGPKTDYFKLKIDMTLTREEWNDVIISLYYAFSYTKNHDYRNIALSIEKQRDHYDLTHDIHGKLKEEKK